MVINILNNIYKYKINEEGYEIDIEYKISRKIMMKIKNMVMVKVTRYS